LVFSSVAKIEEVAPSSVPRFVIVVRSGIESFSAPGPVYSKILPTPPLTVSSPSRERHVLGGRPRGELAFEVDVDDFRHLDVVGPPPIATAMSRPPAPIASSPEPAGVGVCESEPSRVLPGAAKFSLWTWWQIPFPGREKYAPYVPAAERRNRWSSVFLKSNWYVWWSQYCAASSVWTSSRSGLELEPHHRPRGVLCQHLVDLDADPRRASARPRRDGHRGFSQ